MNKSKQLAEILKENLANNNSKLNKARLQLMSMVVIALCKVQTESFHKLANAFDSKSSVDSSLRRIQRFISNFDFAVRDSSGKAIDPLRILV